MDQFKWKFKFFWCSIKEDAFFNVAHFAKQLLSHGDIFYSCSFADTFWKDILTVFGWSTTLPYDPISLLNYTLTRHPFTDRKKVLWMHLIRVFFWATWIKCNQRIINDKIRSTDMDTDTTRQGDMLISKKN